MRQLAIHVLEDASRNAQSSGFRQVLKASRNVDAVAIQVAALHHHIAKIDSDAQDDSPAFLGTLVGDRHALLKRYSATNRLNGAAKLDQHAVAHELHDPAVVSGYQGLDDFCPAALERGQRARLIDLHQPAVADHVCSQDGGKATPWHLFRHTERPPMVLYSRF